ncbi:TAXI family TRAP transporter solute-binding subunit [Bacillus sp. FJAT-44742]|uniref:TAXI family TRAP transporter solute-binding subunit n=1 Tax=Bacillus sp. FJAT-44742 TaxID=2014005 RepID=UPI000C24175D|nr:TAXI family TRAP transporter solute-binding subunit [Bacillus sp. FJAT-44742]
MKSKFSFLLVMLLTFGLFLAACGEAEDGVDEGAEDAPDTEETEDDAAEDDGEAAGDEMTRLQLGTGSTGGTYYPLGQEMANVMNNHVEYEDFDVSSVSSGASVDNLAQISRGEMQLGMTVHLPAQDAINGEGEFEGHAVENVGFMGHIYPEVMQIVTTEGSGIESVEDLEGANVAIGPPGSGTQEAARLILEAAGLEDGDYNAYEEGFGDAAGQIQDGNIDASFGLLGLPDSTIDELSNQRDLRIISISDDILDEVEANSGYERMEIEADSYDFMEESAMTVTAYAVLVGSTDQVSEELGYEITRALYENADEISHTQGQHTTKENVMNGSDDLPLHPGAERYFEEEGLLD